MGDFLTELSEVNERMDESTTKLNTMVKNFLLVAPRCEEGYSVGLAAFHQLLREEKWVKEKKCLHG
jgi:hypothetical protein